MEEMTVTEAARVLQRHHIKRAPVTRGDKLVGIVTRADLLRPYLRTDAEILAEIEDNVIRRALGLSPRGIDLSVGDGVVTIKGRVRGSREKAILLRLVRSVDGVVDVEDDLEIEAD